MAKCYFLTAILILFTHSCSITALVSVLVFQTFDQITNDIW